MNPETQSISAEKTSYYLAIHWKSVKKILEKHPDE